MVYGTVLPTLIGLFHPSPYDPLSQNGVDIPSCRVVMRFGPEHITSKIPKINEYHILYETSLLGVHAIFQQTHIQFHGMS